MKLTAYQRGAQLSVRLLGHCFNGATLDQLRSFMADLMAIEREAGPVKQLDVVDMMLGLRSHRELCSNLALVWAEAIAALPAAEREGWALLLGEPRGEDAASDLVGPQTRHQLPIALARREAELLGLSLGKAARAPQAPSL